MSNDLLLNRVIVVEVVDKNGDVKVYSDLSISFNVEKTASINSNKSTITIYNLNETSRSSMEKDGLKLFLYVGYESQDSISQLMSGDIVKATSALENNDWKTVLEIGDSEVTLNESITTASFEEGVERKKVIERLISDLEGISVKDIKAIKSNDKIDNALTIFDQTKKKLQEHVDAQELEVIIHDGALYILEPKEPLPGKAIPLSVEKGLLGSPEKAKDIIKFKSLINTAIYPGRKLEVKSRSINGSFKVKNVSFSGSNYDNNWYAQGEALSL